MSIQLPIYILLLLIFYYRSFQYLYHQDVAKYGDPTTTNIVLVSSPAITDNQYTVISKWAKTVEPPAEKKGNKRLRVDDGENDAGRVVGSDGADADD